MPEEKPLKYADLATDAQRIEWLWRRIEGAYVAARNLGDAANEIGGMGPVLDPYFDVVEEILVETFEERPQPQLVLPGDGE